MTSDTPTDPNGFDTPSDAYKSEASHDDAPERFAALVAKELDARVLAIVAVEASTHKAVRDLADAFNAHTSDESKRHAAMLKALAIKSATPMVAMLVSLLALGMAMGSGSAQAESKCHQTESAR